MSRTVFSINFSMTYTTPTIPGINYEEGPAVVLAILLSTAYLKGVQLKIETNHIAFHWILNFIYASGNVVRWCLRLSQLQIDGMLEACFKHQAADAL